MTFIPLVLLLFLLFGISVFVEPVTSKGIITRLLTQDNANEDVYVIIDNRTYWIDKNVPNFNTIYTRLLTAHKDRSTIEIVGNTTSPRLSGSRVSNSVYRICRVSIMR